MYGNVNICIERDKHEIIEPKESQLRFSPATAKRIGLGPRSQVRALGQLRRFEVRTIGLEKKARRVNVGGGTASVWIAKKRFRGDQLPPGGEYKPRV